MGDLDAIFPIRVLQVVNEAGIGLVTTDGSLTGNGAIATPLGDISYPYSTAAYGGPLPRQSYSMQLSIGNGQTCQMNIPSTAVAGDLLVAAVAYLNSAAVPTPAGWAALDAELNIAASQFVKWFTRTMQAGDTSVSFGAIGGGTWSASLIALAPGSRGALGIDAHALTNGGGSQTGGSCEITGSITPARAANLQIFGVYGARSWFPPRWMSRGNGGSTQSGWLIDDPYGPSIVGTQGGNTTPIRWLFSRRNTTDPNPPLVIPNNATFGAGQNYAVFQAVVS